MTAGRSNVIIMYLTASFKQIEEHGWQKLIMIVNLVNKGAECAR